MLTIEYAKNPKALADGHVGINLTVKFVEMDKELPFLATPDDTMPYGVDLYNRAIAGEFGEIEPFDMDALNAFFAQNQPTTEGIQNA